MQELKGETTFTKDTPMASAVRRRVLMLALTGWVWLLGGCDRSAAPAEQAAATAAPAAAADIDPAALYQSRCAQCHEGGFPKAPHLVTFQLIGRDGIHAALTTGLMQTHAEGLSAAEIDALATHLGGAARAETPPRYCEPEQAPAEPVAAPSGWGLTLESTRFVPEHIARLPKAAVPRLELAWAFAYPGATRARSQPSYHAGRVYVGSQSGAVYALDLRSGCAYWTFQAATEVRSSPSIAVDQDGHAERLLFGDIAGTVYAIGADEGEELWRTRAGDHANLTLTGSPRLHGNRLYVPLSSSEWASAADPAYPCCTFRGGVVAMDIATGEILWTSHSIPAAPAPVGSQNDGETIRYHPAGAPVWNSPTIDVKRNRLYVGTGEAYTSPAADTSDAVLAMDLDTGELLWHYQSIPGDAWNMACYIGGGLNCPAENGPDLDIGAPPVLLTLPGGKDILVVGQKSSHVFALDPDADGALLWREKLGRGGFAGGVHWGLAAGEGRVYAPNADTVFTGRFEGEPKPGLFALDPATGDVHWFTPAPDACAPESRPACDPGLSAPVTAIPGVVFAGGFDGHLRAYDAQTGAVLWDYDTNVAFETVSGAPAHGGSIESAGPVVVDGHVLVNSGYLFGDRMAGNVLLAFRVPGDG